MADLGNLLVVGGLLAIVGLALMLGARVPGDIVYRKGSFTVYLPIATSIHLSLLLTLLFSLFRR